MKSFLQLLDNLSSDITPENADNGRIYAIVYNQTNGLKPPVKNQTRFKPSLALSVLIGLAVLVITSAAYYYASVSNIFDNVFKEAAPNGQIVPLSTDSPLAEVVERSGAVLYESVVVDGVEVALRGVVGAGSELKILIDIEDLSGKPLTLYNADGTQSENPLYFSTLRIRTNETLDYVNLLEGSRFLWDDIILTAPEHNETVMTFKAHPRHKSQSEVIKSDVPHKATILLSISLDGESIEDFMDENLYLVLGDIIQDVFSDGINMEADLYSIVSELNNVTDADFRRSGATTDNFDDWIWSYELITDSGKEILLTDKTDDYTVTNAALRDGVLYLRGNLPNYNYDDSFYYYLPAGSGRDSNLDFGGVPFFTLINTKTGEPLHGSSGGGTGDPDGIARWGCSFEGVGSLEELKDYALVLDYGLQSRVLSEGKWDFEVSLSFENLVVTHDVNQKFSLGGFEFTAKGITVSPYFISMNLTVDDENYEKLNYIREPLQVDWNPIALGYSEWDRFVRAEQPEALLIMADGNEIAVKIPFNISFISKDVVINFTPEVVIDPEQIKYINIGDSRFEIN
ncbi:MAG: hypothetical protein FWG70_11120 [Oscillospiraceae bacterium]|nr:hypothetical protein [Oscillospiraceae bacterium]